MKGPAQNIAIELDLLVVDCWPLALYAGRRLQMHEYSVLPCHGLRASSCRDVFLL